MLCMPGSLEHTAGALHARERAQPSFRIRERSSGNRNSRGLSSGGLCRRVTQLSSSMTERSKDRLTKGWVPEICLLCELGHITFPLGASISLFIKLRGGFLTFFPQRQKHLSAPKEVYEETPKYKTGERNSRDGSTFVGCMKPHQCEPALPYPRC